MNNFSKFIVVVLSFISLAGTISSIRNGKVVVETTKSGKDCGIILKSSNDVITDPQEGDVIKTGTIVPKERDLEWYPEGF